MWIRDRIILIALFGITLSGCFTPRVYYLGRRRINGTSPEKVYLGEDKAIALEGRQEYTVNPSVFYDYRSSKTMEKMLKENGLVNQAILQIQMNPNSTQLPVDFLMHASTYSADGLIPYTADGLSINIRVHKSTEFFTKRPYWSYACQVFLVPAVALDVALSPLYFALIITTGEIPRYSPN